MWFTLPSSVTHTAFPSVAGPSFAGTLSPQDLEIQPRDVKWVEQDRDVSQTLALSGIDDTIQSRTANPYRIEQVTLT